MLSTSKVSLLNIYYIRILTCGEKKFKKLLNVSELLCGSCAYAFKKSPSLGGFLFLLCRCFARAFGWATRGFLWLVRKVFFRLFFCDGLWIDVLWDADEVAATWAFDVWTIGAINNLNFAPVGDI